jgi:hypothetical protein
MRGTGALEGGGGGGGVVRPLVVEAHHDRAAADSDSYRPAAGLLGDLLVLDPVALVWTNLSGLASGPAPARRCGHGFAAMDGKLYAFGGQGGESVGHWDLRRDLPVERFKDLALVPLAAKFQHISICTAA